MTMTYYCSKCKKEHNEEKNYENWSQHQKYAVGDIYYCDTCGKQHNSYGDHYLWKRHRNMVENK